MIRCIIAALAVLLPALPVLAQPFPPTATGAHPGFVASRWYRTLPADPDASTSVAGGGNLATCYFGVIPQTATITSMALASTTTDNGKNVQVAIYSNGAFSRPQSLLAATANIVMGASGAVLGGGIQVRLDPGGYWWCANTESTTAIFRSRQAGFAAVFGAATIGSANAPGSVGTTQVAAVSTPVPFGNWPNFDKNTPWTDVTTSIAPDIAFYVYSVP